MRSYLDFNQPQAVAKYAESDFYKFMEGFLKSLIPPEKFYLRYWVLAKWGVYRRPSTLREWLSLGFYVPVGVVTAYWDESDQKAWGLNVRSYSLDFNPFAQRIADALSKYGDVELLLASVTPPPLQPGLVRGKVKCPYCGHYYRREITACPHCGAPAPAWAI